MEINPQTIMAELYSLNHETEHNKTEVTAQALLNMQITEIPCLVDPFLQQVGLACLAGSSDTGKSSILRQLALCIATGSDTFIGYKINARHRQVVFVSTEDDPQAVAFLLSKQAAQATPDKLAGLRFMFDTTNLLENLDANLTAKPADLVIVDCFADAFGGDLKDTTHLRHYLHFYHELALKHQCLVLFLHHTGKRTEHMEPSKNNLLSGQGFEAKLRLVIELRADLQNPHQRHLCIVKGNYLPANFKKESYVLHFDERTFCFTNTGERMPFDMLVKNQFEDTSRDKYEQVMALKKQGKSIKEIAEIMGYSSKGTVAGILARGAKKGWGDNTSDMGTLEDIL